MKIKFLGTIAAEGGPALFCNCDYCREAARRGGKNIRTRSQILVNDDLLVDFPADTYFHKLQYGLELSRVRELLITHSHHDHFYPTDLFLHGGQNAHDMTEPLLNIYGNDAVRALYEKAAADQSARITDTLCFHTVSSFEHVVTDRYEFWTLPAAHMKDENALFYLIRQGDRAFLQCNDTGLMAESVFEFLSSLGVRIDVIALDSTMGAVEKSYFGHMNVKECIETVARMRESNFVKPSTRFVLTHFCHNGKLLHEDYEAICAPHGIEIAFDGMEIEV